MKNLFLIIFGLLTFSGFSQDYLLADENSDKTMIADFIEKSIAEKKLKKNPVIVVNERVLKDDELDKLNFYKSDILEFSLVAMDNTQMVEIYGEQSLNGVLLIETKPFQEKAAKSISDSKVLFLINDKQITQAELKKINPDTIESLNVIKDKKEIAKYTTDEYDGVVIIKLKKTE
ncbi:hypothetical protein [Thalassobellus suaedae]|uniref:TonB-dependent receptor plug domain-containing protein n=1 Tax=Thalassobellus suaedae TaxID=3074124 RepID=A0ABY9Y4A2_9FLAO|nr:hypothetical protein RHP49_02015 [Flavobacteriaceae bacterium HL-DH10]